MIKKELLVAVLIIGISGIVSFLFVAEGATIGDVTSTFQNIVILGSCTGCGDGTTYTSWTSITATALSGTMGNKTIDGLYVDNNGNVYVHDTQPRSYILFNNGTFILSPTNSQNELSTNNVQSASGKYVLIVRAADELRVYSNGIKVNSGTIGTGDFNGVFPTNVKAAISPNGKFVVMAGRGAVDTTTMFLKVLQGS